MKQDKIALPNTFQFRVDAYPGYTHTAKQNAHGDYEVKWARGWHLVKNPIERTVAHEHEVQEWVNNGGWLVVEDKPKQGKLPDEFYFDCFEDDTIYKATRDGTDFRIEWSGMRADIPCRYTEAQLTERFNSGDWKFLHKKPLTPEQQRTIKDFKEQLLALDSSIKISEQDIEHKQRLIGNYKARQDTLREKIEAIEKGSV
jgi:hypothetical protein